MGENRRVASNTVALYIRSFLCLLISLYTSRLVLATLGASDYGLYNAVGGFATMFWMVSGSLSATVCRFLTFEIGRGDREKTKVVFSMSLSIHLVFSILVLIIALTYGIHYVDYEMNIPDGRETACRMVFITSIISIVLGLVVIPFNATIVAHENLTIFAWMSISEACLKMMGVVVISKGLLQGDLLELYAIFMMGAASVIQLWTAAYSTHHYPECRFRWVFDRQVFSQLFDYAGWSFWGSISSMYSVQGVNLVINKFNGPVVNAARGISVTVNSAVGNFVNNFTMSIAPQITKTYAVRQYERMFNLLDWGTRVTYYSTILFVLPLCLETDFLLKIWLGDYPDHTVSFLRLVLFANALGASYSILGKVQAATGKMKIYQLCFSVLNFLNYPLSYYFLSRGYQPEASFVIALALSFCCLVANVVIVHHSVRLDIMKFSRAVFPRIILVTVLSLLLPVFMRSAIPGGWWRFFAVSLSSVASVLASSIFVGCSREERKILLSLIKTKLRRHV